MPPSTTAAIVITANPSRLPQGLRVAAGYLGQFAIGAKNVLSKINLAPAAMKGKSWVQTAVGSAVGSLAVRGLDALIDQGKQIFDFQEALTRFGIAARKTGPELDYIGKSIRQVSTETGLAAVDVLRGARAYVDMAGAAAYSNEKMLMMARVSQATKSDMGDLAQVVFQLQHAMKIPDNELENTLGGVINMSKDGAVHFAQMSQEISELAPQAARYGMVGRRGMNELAAVMQVTRTGFASVSEMGTGITRIFSGLTMHSDKFEKYGVRIFNTAKDGTKTWRHFADILDDIQKNDLLRKDPHLLRKAFGRSEAERSIRLLFEQKDALRELEKAGERDGVVMQDLNTYTQSSAGRMAVAMEKMKNAVAEAFTPERINRFVSAIEDAANKVGPLVEAVGKIGDILGHLYNAGKAVRGFFSSGGSKIRESSPEEIQRYAGEHNMSVGQAVQALQLDHARRMKFIQDIHAMMPDDRTTPQSDKFAVRTRMTAESGSDLANAANDYINEAGLSVARVRELEAEARKDMVNEDIAAGRGRSRQADDMLAQFNRAIETTLAPAVARSIMAAQEASKAPQVHLDGNRVSHAIKQSTGQRRR